MNLCATFAGVLGGTTLVVSQLACSGGQDQPFVRHTPSIQLEQQPERGNVPNATVQEITDCAESAKSRFTKSMYAFQYRLIADEDGKVTKVMLRDATFHDAELQDCIQRSLAAMSVPESALGLRSPKPVSGGERVSSEQLGPLGSAESESPLIFLGPLVLDTVGTQILLEIGVIVGVLASVTEDDERDAERACQIHYVDCLMTEVADRKGHKHGHTRCLECRNACMQNKGVWPSRAKRTTGTVSCEYWRK